MLNFATTRWIQRIHDGTEEPRIPLFYGGRRVNILKKSEFRNILAAVLVFLLVVLFFVPDQGLAAEVWVDDFDDGDLEGWLANDHCINDNLRLRGTDTGAAIHHPSTVSVGTWSFDVVDEGEFEAASDALWVYFMCSDPSVPPVSYYSMNIIHVSKGAGYQYVYYLAKGSTNLASHDGIEGADLRGTLHHMAISRTDSGVIRVFLNGSRIIEVTNTEITTSQCFKTIFGYDWAMDNIVVDNTPPDEGIPFWLLVIIVGGASAVIIAVVVFLRRR